MVKDVRFKKGFFFFKTGEITACVIQPDQNDPGEGILSGMMPLMKCEGIRSRA